LRKKVKQCCCSCSIFLSKLAWKTNLRVMTQEWHWIFYDLRHNSLNFSYLKIILALVLSSPMTKCQKSLKITKIRKYNFRTVAGCLIQYLFINVNEALHDLLEQTQHTPGVLVQACIDTVPQGGFLTVVYLYSNKRAQRALGRSPEKKSKVTVEPFTEDH